MSYTIRHLNASTWDAFAELIERNNGIFGGCWCIGYHPECGQKGISYRSVKEVRELLGDGLVEAIPGVTAGRQAPGRFLFSATVELFEQYGFTRGRQVGKHAWIVSRVVDPV